MVTNHRADLDFYSTDSFDAYSLITHTFISPNVWECCAGNGAISKVLLKHNFTVRSTDILQRDFPLDYTFDFLSPHAYDSFDGDIVTNPPYALATEFVLKAIHTVTFGHRVAMFLPITFLESQKRYKEIFSIFPPKEIIVSSKRTSCYVDGLKKVKNSRICFAWFVWEKGYYGSPVIRWYNTL